MSEKPMGRLCHRPFSGQAMSDLSQTGQGVNGCRAADFVRNH
jgi:hypothetical protein